MVEAGTAVTVVHLVGRSDLNGKDGVAERMCASTGRYVCDIEGEQVKIRATNLVVKDHREEVDPIMGEMLTCNGLRFCAAHRLECCGVCQAVYRPENRLRQLGAFALPEGPERRKAVKLAQALDRKEERENLPPLRAPRAGETVAGTSSEEREEAYAASTSTLGSKKELVARGLDPSTLPPWGAADGSIARPFQDAMSMHESFRLNALPGRAEAGYPSASQDAFLTLRHTLLVVAFACEKHRGAPPGSPAALLPRFSVQDAAESEVLMWDVIAIAKEEVDEEEPEEEPDQGGGGTQAEKKKKKKKKKTPILTVRYGYFTSASLSKALPAMQASLRLLPKGTPSAPLTSRVEEIRLLRSLLEKNAARLDPAFLARAERGLPEGFRVSTIRPVTTESAPKSEGEIGRDRKVCAACGKAKANKVCSRCKETFYCSAKCQKEHWKQHKRKCRDLEGGSTGGAGGAGGGKGKGKGIVDVDLSASTGFPGMQTMTMNFARSQSQNKHEGSGKTGGSAHRDDVIFIVKVQVHPTGYPSPNSPMNMMCYDKSRKLNIQITEQNCSPGPCRSLDRIIRRGNIANGLKGYFKAFLKKGILKILSNEPLPLQPW